MKASLLCGAHYEGAEAHLTRPPVPPAMCDPAIAQRSFDHFLHYAARADELGFDWISVSEHHASPLILAPSVAPLAGALTQLVRNARIALLGPLAPLNNPVRIAEEIAMLDHLSHGRLVVLILRGSPPELKTYQPRDLSQTQPITQEATRLIRKALSATELFDWDGEFFHYVNVAVWPRLLQHPHPPMYFSGNSLNSAVFAAREKLGLCLSFHRPEVVAATVHTYLDEAAQAGWRPVADELVYRNFVVVADTDERAFELADRFVAAPSRYLLDGPAPAHAGASAVADASATETASALFPHGKMLFAGSPDTVVERIRAFHEMTGVGVIDLIFGSGQLTPPEVQRSVELFGREVLPRIREIGVPTDSPALAARA